MMKTSRLVQTVQRGTSWLRMSSVQLIEATSECRQNLPDLPLSKEVLIVDQKKGGTAEYSSLHGKGLFS